MERLGAQESIPWANEMDSQHQIDEVQLKDPDQDILDEPSPVVDHTGPPDNIYHAQISGVADLAIDPGARPTN
jgi:hypothetical protein